MNFSVRAKNVVSPEEVSAHVEKRARFALARFYKKVESVDVLVEDINGPRGGVDQRCRYMVRLNRVPMPVIIDVKRSDIASAIDVASDQICRTVNRTLSRMRDRRRRSFAIEAIRAG